jgi:hypothetical protein
MRESYGEGIASHTGPESCAVVCKGQGEALTGVRAGRVLSHEIWESSGSRRRRSARKAIAGASLARDAFAPCAVVDPESTHGNTSHGNREILWPPPEEGGRIGKSKDARR